MDEFSKMLSEKFKKLAKPSEDDFSGYQDFEDGIPAEEALKEIDQARFENRVKFLNDCVINFKATQERLGSIWRVSRETAKEILAGKVKKNFEDRYLEALRYFYGLSHDKSMLGNRFEWLNKEQIALAETIEKELAFYFSSDYLEWYEEVTGVVLDEDDAVKLLDGTISLNNNEKEDVRKKWQDHIAKLSDKKLKEYYEVFPAAMLIKNKTWAIWNRIRKESDNFEEIKTELEKKAKFLGLNKREYKDFELQFYMRRMTNASKKVEIKIDEIKSKLSIAYDGYCESVYSDDNSYFYNNPIKVINDAISITGEEAYYMYIHSLYLRAPKKIEDKA